MSRARVIPAVDHLLGLPAVDRLARLHGGRLVRQAIDRAVQDVRDELLAGRLTSAGRDDAAAIIVARLEDALREAASPSLRTVLNATGVVLHTNLGRAPLAPDAIAAMSRIASGYSTLEFDLETGQRGSRHTHLDAQLRELTGAEAGLATNNTAAGVTLALAALAAGREVVISRGELVEIGGGFRVPEILRGSGALLREVGTTNRTRVADYAAAISDRTAAILRVHPSNFRVTGFTERPDVGALAALARRMEIPLIEDLGSGWPGADLLTDDDVSPAARALLSREPSVRQSVGAGVDLVAFSGDKLLGGPQSGLVVGRAALVAELRTHPLMRAIRVDKLTSAALDATLRVWNSGRAATALPVMRMITTPGEVITGRAEALAARLTAEGLVCDVSAGLSTVGGGSLPDDTLPTTLVRLTTPSPDGMLARLRLGDPVVVARIAEHRVCLDLRTIAPAEDQRLGDAVLRAGER